MSLKLPVDLAREAAPPGWSLQGFSDVQQNGGAVLRAMTAREAAVTFDLPAARPLELRYDFVGREAGQRLELSFNGAALRAHRIAGPDQVAGALLRVEGRAGENVLTWRVDRLVPEGGRAVAANFFDLQVAPYAPPQGWWGRSVPSLAVALVVAALLLWGAARLLGLGRRV